MLSHYHQGVFILICLRDTIVLAVGILHIFFQVGQLLQLLLHIFSFANEQLEWKVPGADVNRDAQLKIILMPLEPIKQIFGYDAMSSYHVELEVGVQKVLSPGCKIIKFRI